jgi:hypothetical protein
VPLSFEDKVEKKRVSAKGRREEPEKDGNKMTRKDYIAAACWYPGMAREVLSPVSQRREREQEGVRKNETNALLRKNGNKMTRKQATVVAC